MEAAEKRRADEVQRRVAQQARSAAYQLVDLRLFTWFRVGS